MLAHLPMTSRLAKPLASKTIRIQYKSVIPNGIGCDFRSDDYSKTLRNSPFTETSPIIWGSHHTTYSFINNPSTSVNNSRAFSDYKILQLVQQTNKQTNK